MSTIIFTLIVFEPFLCLRWNQVLEKKRLCRGQNYQGRTQGGTGRLESNLGIFSERDMFQLSSTNHGRETLKNQHKPTNITLIYIII